MNDSNPNREPESAQTSIDSLVKTPAQSPDQPASGESSAQPAGEPSAESPPPSSPIAETSSSAYTILSVPISLDGPDRDVWLTVAQQSALECLFNGGSVTAAARSAGVTRQTVNKWIRSNRDFKTVYEAWHRDIQKNVKDRMTALADAAMDNLTQAIQINGDLRTSQFVVKHLLERESAAAE